MAVKRQIRDMRGYDRGVINPSRMSGDYYGHSDFINLGYWTRETKDQAEASRNLVEKLISFFPEKRGRVLDVACGLGASTRLLGNHFKASDVTAINISSVQVGKARVNAPDSSFLVMDAANLAFPDETFDQVLCVEAAFHFNTRQDFYKEAFRVLKPGGRFVTADILFSRFVQKEIPSNHVQNPAALSERLRLAGFTSAEVLDTTDECWRGCSRNVRRWPAVQYRAGNMPLWKAVGLTLIACLAHPIARASIRYYVFTAAQKPLAS
jgi:MPBQ/MSBQ methyltransferase